MAQTKEYFQKTIPPTYWERKELKQELNDIDLYKQLNSRLTYGTK